MNVLLHKCYYYPYGLTHLVTYQSVTPHYSAKWDVTPRNMIGQCHDLTELLFLYLSFISWFH